VAATSVAAFFVISRSRWAQFPFHSVFK
jgi:hypothetical protein